MKNIIAIAGLLLILGCSPDSTSTAEGPGNEATSETSPAQEDTTPFNDGGDSGDAEGEDRKAVSVDLPGLPIGGSEAVFSPDAPTQCVDVNLTGFTLPDGVGIEFTKIKVPEQFTVQSSPCSDAPCIGGSYRITAETGGCTVSVTWKAEPLDAGRRYALSANAKALCTSRMACAEVKAAADAANEQTGGQFAIGLIVNASADGESTPVDGESTPADGESTPVDGESTPADGEPEGSSPSDDTSGS